MATKNPPQKARPGATPAPTPQKVKPVKLNPPNKGDGTKPALPKT